MASTAAIAAQMERAHKRASAVVEKYGDQETAKNLATVGMPSTRRPETVFAVQAELIAALAERVEELAEAVEPKPAAQKKKEAK